MAAASDTLSDKPAKSASGHKSVSLHGTAMFTGGLSAEAFLSLGSMEGVYDPVLAPTTAERAPSVRSVLASGYVFAAGVALLSMLIHRLPFLPFTVDGGSAIRHPVSARVASTKETDPRPVP